MAKTKKNLICNIDINMSIFLGILLSTCFLFTGYFAGKTVAEKESHTSFKSYITECIKNNQTFYLDVFNGEPYCDIFERIRLEIILTGKTYSFSMNNSRLNDTSLTIQNNGNATSFDLNLTSNDSSNISIRDTVSNICPICVPDEPPPIKYAQIISKDSVCFDKNTNLNFIPDGHIFQYIPAYDIKTGYLKQNIPIRDLSEIKYFCQDLNITIKG